MNGVEGLPCHQMPDGSWMGNCDDQETLDHMDDDVIMRQGMGMMHSEGIIPGGDVQALQAAKSSTIVDLQDGDRVSLSADIVEKEINGETYVMYGYDGRIPGPAYRVSQGSRVTIDFTNNIDMETTVHWHGLRHDVEFDGVPGISQDPVQPGESFTYELYFPDDGIYWYHPHVREDIQQDAGLAGNMIVLPDTAYNPVNREELVIVDDILVENGEHVPFGEDDANFAVMGRFGNVLLTNGETRYELVVEQGEVVRFYFTNVANVRPFNLSIPGVEMKLVGGDMGQYEREEFVDNIVIAPAQRVFVDVYFEEAGEYELMNINPHEEYVLGLITVSNTQTGQDYSEEFYNDVTNQEVIDDIQSFSQYFDKPADYEFTLDVSMGMMDNMPCHAMMGMVMGDCSTEEREQLEEQLGMDHDMTIEWEDEMNMRMNGAMVEWIMRDEQGNENMDASVRAQVGDKLKMRFFNDPNSMHPMQHPIHLHGQRFVVTHIDGEPVENKVWTDTVLVPIGSTVDILVDVTNPGEWMLHCHIAEHLEEGMMTSFNVEA